MSPSRPSYTPALSRIFESIKDNIQPVYSFSSCMKFNKLDQHYSANFDISLKKGSEPNKVLVKIDNLEIVSPDINVDKTDNLQLPFTVCTDNAGHITDLKLSPETTDEGSKLQKWIIFSVFYIFNTPLDRFPGDNGGNVFNGTGFIETSLGVCHERYKHHKTVDNNRRETFISAELDNCHFIYEPSLRISINLTVHQIVDGDRSDSCNVDIDFVEESIANSTKSKLKLQFNRIQPLQTDFELDLVTVHLSKSLRKNFEDYLRKPVAASLRYLMNYVFENIGENTFKIHRNKKN